MQDTAGIFLISCNRIRLFPDMMDVSMLIQNAKEGCGMDDRQLLRQLQEQRAGALEAASRSTARMCSPSSAIAAAAS